MNYRVPVFDPFGRCIMAEIPLGQTVKIDLKRIPVEDSPDGLVSGKVEDWSGFEFATTGVVIMWFLETTMPAVSRVVCELSDL